MGNGANLVKLRRKYLDDIGLKFV